MAHTSTPSCPWLKRIVPLVAPQYLLLCLLISSCFLYRKNPKKLSFSVCSHSSTKVTYQYLLLLVGFGTLIYQKCYNRSPTVEGHQVLLSGAVAGERSAIS